MILAKTVKGWTLGAEVEGRNATHQIKKLTNAQLRTLRERLHLHDEIPEEALADDAEPPYFKPDPDSPEGALPRRPAPGPRRPAPQPRGHHQATAHAAARRRLRRVRRRVGQPGRVDHHGLHPAAAQPVPGPRASAPGSCRSSPTRPAPSAWTPCSRSSGSTPRRASSTSRSTTTCCSPTRRRRTARSSRRASPRPARWRRWIAAGTSYATRGVPMVPFFTFYSMFGFQRVGDLIWQAADMRARGFLMGATAGRTTLLGEGLQHQDGHSLRAGLHRAACARPTTPPSPTRPPPSSATASSACTATRRRTHGDPTSSTTSPSTTRTT